MSLAFTIYCGRCFRVVQNNSEEGGSVLSCGDFLCSSCAQLLVSSASCPACGKQGVRAVFLKDSLPEEVKLNVSDPTKEMERLHNMLTFQVKYYKQLIKKLVVKMNQVDQDSQTKSK